ncbi:hypothetical protein HAX54_048362 [Datura stramonium]|uniref:Uncharacterized protein n=1 Tax=Datura stramonium TaxID=4076 RepID=A0ABS8SUG0_DATST|nr:hypothetical protein [Datura stramonium]
MKSRRVGIEIVRLEGNGRSINRETIEFPAERALSLGTFEVKHEENCQRISDQNMSAFFDVDDILYPLSFGISAQCMKNIIDYMIEKLGIDETKVSEMCISLYKEYGTTMAGLRAIGFDFDYDDYHSFVHGRLPYELLKTDYVLRIFCIACVSGKFFSSDQSSILISLLVHLAARKSAPTTGTIRISILSPWNCFV